MSCHGRWVFPQFEHVPPFPDTHNDQLRCQMQLDAHSTLLILQEFPMNWLFCVLPTQSKNERGVQPALFLLPLLVGFSRSSLSPHPSPNHPLFLSSWGSEGCSKLHLSQSRVKASASVHAAPAAVMAEPVTLSCAVVKWLQRKMEIVAKCVYVLAPVWECTMQQVVGEEAERQQQARAA